MTSPNLMKSSAFEEFTEITVGLVLSMTIALFDDKEPLAPGLGKTKLADVPKLSNAATTNVSLDDGKSIAHG